MKPTLVLVGGYLGAGKTTLLLKAADILEQRRIRTGLVMNDQGVDLVDTDLAALAGRDVRDVTGACFCCDFPSLVENLESLAATGAEVIIAEPVGSCTDIVRTVVHPLQEIASRWHVAPFTVLIDPARAGAMLSDRTAPDLAYLFQMQMDEADLLVASKADSGIVSPVPVAASISAQTGEGVEAWLDLVLGSTNAAGSRKITVDYARYGAAEASLAWMNWRATVTCRTPTPALAVLGPFVEDIRIQLRADGHEIAHLKALDTGEGGYLRVGLCGTDEEFSLEGAVIGDWRWKHRLILNLRAECAPEAAMAALAHAIPLLEANSAVEVDRDQCFRPAMPSPSVDRTAT